MFNKEALQTLYGNHHETLEKMVALETELKGRFYGMDATVECMMLAALTGEPMVMIGPPGTAKSRLIRSFCNLMGLIDDDALTTSGAGGTDAIQSERYFEYLLTQFTEPSELFGYYDLARLFAAENREFIRDSTGMMQKAEVVFLDEVFNASSAILNALLTFMNERKFHDRGEVQRVPMKLLFAASNHPPLEDGLGAVYDRFLLRSRVLNVAPDAERLAELVSVAWRETHATPGAVGHDYSDLLERLDQYRGSIDNMTKAGELTVQETDPLFWKLADLVTELRRKDLSEMSNRRLVKFTGVIMANALLRTARAGRPKPTIEPADLEVILNFGLDSEDESTVRKLTEHLLQS
ncbi:MAG: AAA family ATPase [Rhodobacteraceae bacterium]|nr:AAA family ATPase [Paracoccaceae bacterium]